MVATLKNKSKKELKAEFEKKILNQIKNKSQKVLSVYGI